MLERAAALTALALAVATASQAAAADLPAIKLSDDNQVPECVTPGRLMAFLDKRSGGKFDRRFEKISVYYMRLGNELQVRWDTAFFQMMLETGSLKFGGDVKPSQNNFAGLGATGKKVPGEAFADVETGVKAHLQHLLVYAGDTVEQPVAERTRNIQEWGVLTSWQKTINRPMTFADMAKKWAPTSRGYSRDVEAITQGFYTGFCNEPDPQPELMAEAVPGTKKKTPNLAVASTAGATSPSTSDLAKRSMESGLTAPAGLGAGGLAGIEESTETGTKAQPAAFTIINAAQQPMANAPAASAETPAAAIAPEVEKPKGGIIKAAALSPATVQVLPAPAKKTCRVWTASYGGQRSVVVKAPTSEGVNYTVLDVNEGAEKREAEAYISAYASGGELVGEFATHDQALEKAFEYCPED